MNKEIDNFVDLLFNFDMKELENETKFLENYKKLQQENQQLKEDLHQASLSIQELIEQDIECPSSCHRWNELKKWLEEQENYFRNECEATKNILVYRYFRGAKNAIGDTLNKMQELERGEE